ncbi:MAG: endonuclease NucS domain-containing protein [Pseudanabaena sp. ELA607]|jgi:hypothetical protein
MSQPVTIEDIYKLFEQTSANLDKTNAALAQSSQEFDRRMAEFDRRMIDSETKAEKRMTEFDQQIKEIGKQIGGLGTKFGDFIELSGFTEDLTLTSMDSVLEERFGVEIIRYCAQITKGKENLKIDVLAYANGDVNAAYVVEVKSHAQEESIQQLKNILNNFRRFFPEHSNKTVYGILAAVDIPEDVKKKVFQEGLYFARISDDTFAMDTPDDFEPKTW